jgi:predicted nucleic-acid-binding Zn-ribbon protein
MNTKRSLKTDLSNIQKTPRKKHRLHTRVQLDTLRPILANFQDSQCPKCQGHVRTEAGESLSQIVIRCLNCGWQPHYQAPIIQETEEARICRLRTAQFVSECDWYRMPVVL